MLVVSGDSRSLATGKIGKPLRSERIIRYVILRGSSFSDHEEWEKRHCSIAENMLRNRC